MRFVVTILAALVLFGASGALHSAWAQRYAAVDLHPDGPGPVVWGTNKEETQTRAVAACKQISSRCKGAPAYTNLDIYPTAVFAFTCCQSPKSACIVGADVSKERALATAQKLFADAGYSNCTVRQYLSTQTGKPM